MADKSIHDSFSFRVNIFIKVLLILAFIRVINAESYLIAGIALTALLTLLLKGKLRNSWLKLVSKLSYALIAYIALDFVLTNDIESALTFVGKLLSYLLLLVWLKESTTLKSYLSDVNAATFMFGANLVSRKLDSFFHYFNFYLIATMKLVSKFVESYDQLFPTRRSFISLFIQVFLNTMLRIPETKFETNAEISVINFRNFDWKTNLPIILLIIILGFLSYPNCEELCRSFF